MDTKKIGQFIAENRKALGMTQRELAEKLGVSDKTVSRWENGNYMPDLSLLWPLSEVLDISLNELLSGEHIEQEKIAEKAEASFASTLAYSEQKIKKSKYQFYLSITGVIVILIFVWLLLNAVLKVIYSDAISFLQKEYHLLPLSQYTYRNYETYGWQIVSDNEAITEQGRKLSQFLDIYENCFEWKQLAFTAEGRTRYLGERFSMFEIFQIAFTLMVLPGLLGIFAIALGVYDLFQDRKLKKLKERTSGEIKGLIKSHLFRNEIHGEVPDDALIGWGVSQGEQFWGGMLKKRIPPWFPCVSYKVDEKEFCRIMGEGVWEGTWKIGQEVVVLYDLKNPRISTIEGDTSLQTRTKLSVGIGCVLLLITVVAIMMFLC